ncbi:hypothetical protein MSAN_00363400 [Mycena sanguinolenta]|uniref:Uncharacterized protein n=1 Tax=Mycena sanguinolenta TaxID=230812 RepID=A0A8H6ZCI8_9AGAR|nr:hypothetical protein MSAN_00363400 [Mycena sanguinolenta]
MPLLGHVLGGAVFGLTARFWQLAILRKPMMSNPAGHAASTVAFAGAGYYWWQATVYMKGVLAKKEAELREKRAVADGTVLQNALDNPNAELDLPMPPAPAA